MLVQDLEDDDILNLKENQLKCLKGLSKEIKYGSMGFKIEHKQFSKFDNMVQEKCLSKNLENDSLIYMEGRPYANPKFISVTDKHEAEQDETLSAADFEEDLNRKEKIIERKDNDPNLGLFESSPYFLQIFPSILIQKPGYDLYGATTIFMFILCIFIFSFYSEISVNKANLMPSKADNSDIFNGTMILNLLFVVLIMIIERYANRTDTKVSHNKRLSDN